jgi:tetratricopeptide (TPR) repeat protein
MTCRAVALALVLGVAALAPVAHAQPAASAREAGKHFQRGVTLYNEADYRAALVEFQRAYDIAPNAAVLYNIGQTYFQLQNYAAALTTLQRYLSEAETNASHRAEVEQTVDTLQSRVGKIAITASTPNCEIAVDDEPVGKTPLRDPVLVSVGRRKVTATCSDRAAETRFVAVVAGDTVPLTLALSDTGTAPAAPPSKAPPEPSNPYVTWGWVTTGVLGAGAITTGVFAYLASRDLKDARSTLGSTPVDLDAKANKVKRLSLAADLLGVATVIAGGITLKLTLSQSKSHEVHVAVVPNGLGLAGTFR